MNDTNRCPCESGLLYSECCGTVLSGQTIVATAEALMRSRYSAYVTADINYLLNTWHPSTKPSSIEPGTIPNWCGLKIIRTEKGLKNDDEGTVEFIAVALFQSKIVRLHEVSHFVKEEEKWLYMSGDIIEDLPQAECKANKTGRNCRCPCGSGKKFKKCCYNDEK